MLELSGVNAKLMHERDESSFCLLQLQQALKQHALAIHVNNRFCQSWNMIDHIVSINSIAVYLFPNRFRNVETKAMTPVLPSVCPN